MNYIIPISYKSYFLSRLTQTKNKWNGYGNKNLISNLTDFKCNLKFEQSGSKYLPFPSNLFGQN